MPDTTTDEEGTPPEGAEKRAKQQRKSDGDAGQDGVKRWVAYITGLVFIVLGSLMMSLPSLLSFPQSKIHAVGVIGLVLLTLGIGLIMAYFFKETIKVNFAGMTIGGAIGISILLMFVFRQLLEQPAFDYVEFSFKCGSDDVKGDLRLAITSDGNNEQIDALTAGLLRLEESYFKRPEGAKDGELATIKIDGNAIQIPMARNFSYLLPTLLPTKHVVVVERKPPVRQIADTQPTAFSATGGREAGRGFGPTPSEYHSVMKIIVTPEAVAKGETVSLDSLNLNWDPKILKAEIHFDQIAENVCD